MKLEAVSLAASSPFAANKAEEKVSEVRKKKEKYAAEPQAGEKSQIAPEELLEQIKGLSEHGTYGVRFENNDKVDELVVQVVDKQTDELIRQIPPEEILSMKAALGDLRGNLVDTQG